MDDKTPILSVLSLTPLSTSSILPRLDGRYLCAVQRYDRLAGRRSASSLGRQLYFPKRVGSSNQQVEVCCVSCGVVDRGILLARRPCILQVPSSLLRSWESCAQDAWISAKASFRSQRVVWKSAIGGRWAHRARMFWQRAPPTFSRTPHPILDRERQRPPLTLTPTPPPPPPVYEDLCISPTLFNYNTNYF